MYNGKFHEIQDGVSSMIQALLKMIWILFENDGENTKNCKKNAWIIAAAVLESAILELIMIG